MRFSVLIESFCGYAVVDNFFDGLEVSNRPSHSSVQWSSTWVLVFVLYCVLNYSRPRSVISFEIVCGIFFL